MESFELDHRAIQRIRLDKQVIHARLCCFLRQKISPRALLRLRLKLR
jgi:hypothetical protein